MKIKLSELLTEDRVAGLDSRSSRSEIVSRFGEPEIDSREHKSYPAMLVYDRFEFRLRADRLTAIALNLSPDFQPTTTVPALYVEFDCGGDLAGIDEELERAGISYERDDTMSEDGSPVYVTSSGAHLAFDGDTLERLVRTF